MKKFMVRLISIVALVLAMMTCFVGCGEVEDGDGEGVVREGVYKFSKLVLAKTDDTPYTYNIGDTAPPQYGGVVLTADFYVFELKADGTCVYSSNGAEIASGTWAVNANDDSKIDITSKGTTEAVPCDGSTITIEMDEGVTMTLVKE